MTLPAISLPYAAGYVSWVLDALARNQHELFTADDFLFFSEVLSTARIAI